jgi:hypothetical protein
MRITQNDETLKLLTEDELKEMLNNKLQEKELELKIRFNLVISNHKFDNIPQNVEG